jgi:alpha-1,2-mannosyltransferase
MDAVPSFPPFAFFQRRWFAVTLVLIFVFLSASYGIKIVDSERDNRSAFLRWRGQVQEMDATGVDIWQRFVYPNPPIMVLLLKPFFALPPVLGSMVWFYVKVLMTLASIFLVFRLVQTPDHPWPDWAKAVVVILSLRPIMGDLTHGNVNLFILLLCVGALACFRLRRDKSAGLLLALAIACKVTPALFVPYFVWKRSYALLASCGVGLVLFFWLVPGLCFGFDRNAQYLHSWFQGMIVPYTIDGVVTTQHENQSLPGVIYRLFTHSASFTNYEGTQVASEEFHNLTNWDPWVARGLIKLLMLAFAGLVVWVCRNPADQRQRWQLSAEYGLILVGMLLFSERTWKHHCVTLLVPFAVLVHALVAGRPSVRLRRFLIAVLVAVSLLMTSTSTGLSSKEWPELARFGKLAEVYGVYAWANLVLTAALVVVLRRQNVLARQARPTGEATSQNVTLVRSSFWSDEEAHAPQPLLAKTAADR